MVGPHGRLTLRLLPALASLAPESTAQRAAPATAGTLCHMCSRRMFSGRKETRWMAADGGEDIAHPTPYEEWGGPQPYPLHYPDEAVVAGVLSGAGVRLPSPPEETGG